jgi:hypothetical protein
MSNPFKDWTPAMVEQHNKRFAGQGEKGLHAPSRKMLASRQGLTPDTAQISNENNREIQSAVAKRPVRNGPLAAAEGKAKGAGRIHVSITSYRSRLTDPDNLCAKATVDCLRYCGILKDDSAKDITYSISQEKTSKENERTEIEIL